MIVQRTEINFIDDVKALMRQQNWLKILPVDIN